METKAINTKLITFSTVAALLGAGFAMAVSASAAEPLTGFGAQRGSCDPERHEALENAMEEGDYAAWKELHGDRGRITSVVTQDNFDTFVEMHEAMESGDTKKASELREELGLTFSPNNNQGARGGMMHGGMGAGRGGMHGNGGK